MRKGEHGSLVVYADRFNKTEQNEKGEDVERSIPFMKGYTVFNVEQIEGLPAHYDQQAAPREEACTLALIEEAETFFAAIGAAFRHGWNRAFYAPAADFIQLPPPDSFRDAESYAATKAHELIHWSGHDDRMARIRQALRRSRLRLRGTGRRTGRGLPLRRSRHHARAARGSCRKAPRLSRPESVAASDESGSRKGFRTRRAAL